MAVKPRDDLTDEHTQPGDIPVLGTARAPLTPGMRLGRYTVKRLLAVGGMGAIYEGLAHDDGERVAIKCLTRDLAADAEGLARFLAEIRSTARIESAHVVRIFDAGGGGADGVPPYYVMEFLEGQDLGDLLERHGPLPIREAVDAVLQACAGLSEAHALGIIHRDIKTSNLFKTNDLVKVVDFGIAKVLELPDDDVSGASPRYDQGKLTQTTSLFGSPSNMLMHERTFGHSVSSCMS
jgi:eukaryotic-like serine/threonine-protein kinase